MSSEENVGSSIVYSYNYSSYSYMCDACKFNYVASYSVICLSLLIGSYSAYTVQTVEPYYGSDHSARPLLSPGSRDSGKIKEIHPEEEVGRASDPTTSGRVTGNSYSETC